MASNMIDTAKQMEGNIPDRYQIGYGELQELHRILFDDKDHEFAAFCTAFRYGFALGAKAQKNGAFRA